VPPTNRKPKEAYMPSPPHEDDGTLGYSMSCTLDSRYYPTISLFKGGEMKVNFTDTLEFPPQTDIEYKVFADRLVECDVEVLVSDMLNKIEADLLNTDVIPIDKTALKTDTEGVDVSIESTVQ